MTLVPAASLMATAYGQGRGLAVVDVTTLEQAEGVVLGAEQAGLPVILQVSQATATFHLDDAGPLAAALAALANTSLVEIALHLDRAPVDGLRHRAAEWGFSSVQVDPGRRPYAEAVDLVAEAVRRGHRRELLVSAELGAVGADDEPAGADLATEPERAADFVARTGVDALVVSASLNAAADVDLIRGLAAAVDVPLVLPGPSGVPQPTMAAAVTAGVTAVTFGAVTTLALTRVIRQQLHDLPDVHDPRQYLTPARKAVSVLAAELIATVGLARSARRPLDSPASSKVS